MRYVRILAVIAALLALPAVAGLLGEGLRHVPVQSAALPSASLPSAPLERTALAANDPLLPEFPRQDADAWLNSKPLKAADLRGQVVLLEVYTSG